jgi:hypothetical protein
MTALYCWWCGQTPLQTNEGAPGPDGMGLVTFAHDCPAQKAHLQRLADVHAENNKRFDRIRNALAVAMRSGGIEGEHHRTWVIDQMVRALTGCAMLVEIDDLDAPPGMVDPSVPPTAEYEAWVAEHNAGEDGAETYTWETGIAP